MTERAEGSQVPPARSLGAAAPARSPAAEARRGSAAHVFVDDLAGPVLTLSEEDEHHLLRVLRLRAGETVSASDGAGSWRLCELSAAGGLDPVGEVEFEPAPSPPVAVGFALTKGDKPEWTVQKLTEVGVDVVMPFTASRSVVRWDPDKAARNHERLARVAREAAMQSRRVWLPEVRPVAPFEAVAGGWGGAAALAEPGGSPVSLDYPCVLVGPEGGWAAEEKAAVAANVSLGPTILRAETAAVAAAVLLCALREGRGDFHHQ